MTKKYEGTFREAAPIHFLFKIDRFSLLSTSSIVKYESNEFETGGYKWKLSLYPDGNKKGNGNDHISLYLELVDTSLSDCWELNVLFRLFLYDHIQCRYFVRGGNPFHEKKKVWGFPHFISLAKFKDPANGFLVDDSCVFGAEVFVSKPPRNIERLSMVEQATTVNHTWKIENFSELMKDRLYKENFKAGNLNWDLIIFPRGKSEGKNNSVDLFLCLIDCIEDPGLKVYTNFKLRLRDQIKDKHIEFSRDKRWFSASSKDICWPKFRSLCEKNDKGKGYLVKDTCIVEAEVKVLGLVSTRP